LTTIDYFYGSYNLLPFDYFYKLRPTHAQYVKVVCGSSRSIGTRLRGYTGNLFLQRSPTVTSLVARSSRGRCAQHLHDARATRCTSYANYVRSICVTYAPDSRRMHITSANPTQMLRALPGQERATRDVTFGPLCKSTRGESNTPCSSTREVTYSSGRKMI
jgi:hypothetical protein